MMALMSLSSTAIAATKLSRLGKAVFQSRSSKRITVLHAHLFGLCSQGLANQNFNQGAVVSKPPGELESPFLGTRTIFKTIMPKGMEGSTEEERVGSTRDFKIMAETDDYVVVEKPPFLLVHPTKPGGPPTLWSELRNLLAFEIANGGQVSIVNRLDRETSGLMLVAKTSAAARRFGRLMQEQRILKEYLAIVWGWPEWEKNSVDAPPARQGGNGRASWRGR